MTSDELDPRLALIARYLELEDDFDPDTNLFLLRVNILDRLILIPMLRRLGIGVTIEQIVQAQTPNSLADLIPNDIINIIEE